MPKPLTMPRAGLFTAQDAPVPLDGVSIEAAISTFCARVVVTQRYVNRESTPIEVVYVFPVDEGAAVSGFEAIIDGTLVVGEVQERDRAFEMYDEAMERGDGAYLLDEERPDVFQASVGNLPPGKEVLLKITYVTELPVQGSAIRFVVPTTVSPRYAPAEDRVGVGRSDAEALNPPLAWRVPYGLHLSVRIATADTISRVESPSHPVSVAVNGREATVTLAQRDAALDRDFVLSIEAAGLDVPHATLERDDEGSAAIAVAFAPELGDGLTPAEVIFVVDRSGSMSGTSIKEVRNALQLCLRSMIPGCCFNIVGFGSTFERLFPDSRAYDERSLAAAGEHVSRLDADLGGTEILPALRSVLEQPPHPSLARQVVLLTDGQVSNTDALIALATAHVDTTRLFTFGIGAGASHHLVNALARAGRGIAEFIAPGERVEPKVVRQFGRLLSPALMNVRVEWHGLEVVQSPTVVPPVFSGGRLLVYGLVKSAIGLKARATLRADSGSGALSFDVAIDPAGAGAGRTIATLAARARIRELEESPEWTMARGSRQSRRKASGVRGEIIALSTKYGLISRETSFVAIERRDAPVQGDVQLRRVPVALTSGWGGVDDTPVLAMPRGAPLAAPLRARPDQAALTMASFGAVQELGDEYSESAAPMSWTGRALRRLRRDRRTPDEPSTGADALIALQRADGSWDLTTAFAVAITGSVSRLEAPLQGASGDPAEVRKAWATALALMWLVYNANDREPEWAMLGAKARQWLTTVRARPAGGGEWLEQAAQFLRP